MKPFDADLKPLEEKLEFARREVYEEIDLASEQRADQELQLIHNNVRLIHHSLQLIHYNDNKRRISDCPAEVKKSGVLQRIEAKADRLFRTQQTEAKADRLFRTQQTEALAEIHRLQIQRMVKEEGIECITTTPPVDLAGRLTRLCCRAVLGAIASKDSQS